MDWIRLAVIVTPRSSRDEVIGWQDGALKIRLRASPVEGQANDALIAFLAKALHIRRSDIEIESGSTSRRKLLRIAAMTQSELERALAARP